MTGDVTDYLYVHQDSFAQRPFCAVDGLALATLVYSRFELSQLATCGSDEAIPLNEILFETSTSVLEKDSWVAYNSGLDAFLDALSESERFAGLSITDFVSEVNDQEQMQFAAAVFHVDGIDYVAFRGTDGSLAGWAEDFNMAYMDQVPSQAAALDFLRRAIGKSQASQIFVGGHSKGGNLAQFAASNLTDEEFAQIDGVFDCDGPGILSPLGQRMDTPEYREKLHKVVPEQSLVGMLMERHEDFRAVLSDEKLVMQHNPLSWQVDGVDFVYAEGVDPAFLAIKQVLDGWLAALDVQQRQAAVEIAFGMLTSDGERSIHDLTDYPRKTVNALIERSRALDEESQVALRKAAAGLGASAASVAGAAISQGAKETRESFERARAEAQAARVERAEQAKAQAAQAAAQLRERIEPLAEQAKANADATAAQLREKIEPLAEQAKAGAKKAGEAVEQAISLAKAEIDERAQRRADRFGLVIPLRRGDRGGRLEPSGQQEASPEPDSEQETAPEESSEK